MKCLKGYQGKSYLCFYHWNVIPRYAYLYVWQIIKL